MFIFYIMAVMGVQPVSVPTAQIELLGTTHGSLLDELARAPGVVLEAVLAIITGGLNCDTGTALDDSGGGLFNASATIVLYCARFAARVDSYVTFLIDWSPGPTDSITSVPRGLIVTDEARTHLINGRAAIRNILQSRLGPLLEDYLKMFERAVGLDPSNKRVLDRFTTLSCHIHAHKLLLYRNYTSAEIDVKIAKTIMGSFTFLTARHVWNNEGLAVPETELYQMLQCQRRRLVFWIHGQPQSVVNEIMQSAFQLNSSYTGCYEVHGKVLKKGNHWCALIGDDSIGRFVVGPIRAMESLPGHSYQSGQHDSQADSSGDTQIVEQVKKVDQFGHEHVNDFFIIFVLVFQYLYSWCRFLMGRPLKLS